MSRKCAFALDGMGCDQLLGLIHETPVALGLHAKVTINRDFGEVRQERPCDRIRPDQANFGPMNGCYEPEAVCGKNRSQQLGTDR